ncbi:hypothetical protein BH09BAC3_BH09BAC3_10260 [soil metagenome]
MKVKLLLLCILSGICPLQATTYYLSNHGNDDASGVSSANSWRTLNKLKLSSNQFHPGDSILFERGSSFNGSLTITASGLPGKDLYIGAYGQGKKPSIRGSIKTGAWISIGNNIWKTVCKVCPDELTSLFINNELQMPGRFPNKGYRAITGVDDVNTSFTDIKMNDSDAKWDGAEAIIKSSRWTIDKVNISSQVGITIKLSGKTSYKLENGFGYFIQNHLSTLDLNGEWFFDKKEKTLFLYVDHKLNPLAAQIEISTNITGLEITNGHDIVIENISFDYHRRNGISITESTNILLKSCDVSFSGKNGMDVTSCSNICVEGSRIVNSSNNGVEWNDNVNASFTHNSISRTGIHEGQGENGNGNYIALHISSTTPLIGKNLIQFNFIDSTGYNGIDFRTGNTSIKNNIVSNFCLVKDDGAGIYTWENNHGGNIIEGNIITNLTSSAIDTSISNQFYASGIYIDDRSSDILIKGNTVSNCAMTGIFLHNARKITLTENTLVGNGNVVTNKERAQLYIKNDAPASTGIKIKSEMLVTKNILVATQEDTPCLYLNTGAINDSNGLGLFGENRYESASPAKLIREYSAGKGLCEAAVEYSLSEWQRLHHQEIGSIVTTFAQPYPVRAQNNLIKENQALEMEGWYAWPEKTVIQREESHSPNGASLKVRLYDQHEALLYHSGFSLDARNVYRLSFSATSTIDSKIEFVPLMADSPWKALGDYTCFSVGPDRRTFVYYFRPHENNKNARINFKGNADFTISEVILSEAVTVREDKIVKLIYNATSHPSLINLKQGEFTTLNNSPIVSNYLLAPYASIVVVDKRVLKH